MTTRSTKAKAEPWRQELDARDVALELESELLGNVILRPASLPDYDSVGVTAEIFSREHTRLVWQAIAALTEDRVPASLRAVKRWLDEHAPGRVDAFWLGELESGVPRLDAEQIASIVTRLRERARQQAFIAACEHAATRVKAHPGEVEGALAAIYAALPASAHTAPTFEAVDGAYRLLVPTHGLMLEVDRLRRERHELVGELAVRCTRPGAGAVAGVLSVADFNLSSAAARQTRAKLLKERYTANSLEWSGLLEELCQRVLLAERTGEPSISLRDVPRVENAGDLQVNGLHLPRAHPSIIFGDGGTLKSYLVLHTLGLLALRGLRVALFDWELSPEDHRVRLDRLFDDQQPDVRYVRCERALVHEVDRLRRIVHEDEIQFAAFDSIAFACDGPPEAAESAAAYFRAVRQIGVGSLHLAHVTKSETGDQRPFGSAFWHNGARATWYVKLCESGPHETAIALLNRKANLRALQPALGFRVDFTGQHTTIRPTDPADLEKVAFELPLWQRLRSALRGGPRTIVELANDLEAKADTVEKALKRGEGKTFTRHDGADGVARWSTLERHHAAQ